MDQHASRAFGAKAESVVEARRFVELLAARWLIVSDDLLLITSELATNAVRHGGGEFELTVSRRGAEVKVEVRDRVMARPVVRQPEFRSPSGRGLRIVDCLAQSWGVQILPGNGKVVWASVSSMDSSPAPDLAWSTDC